MYRMLNQDINNTVTYRGNMSNYNYESSADANRRSIDKSLFRVERAEQENQDEVNPGTVNSNQDFAAEEVLRFFGLSEYPVHEPVEVPTFFYEPNGKSKRKKAKNNGGGGTSCNIGRDAGSSSTVNNNDEAAWTAQSNGGNGSTNGGNNEPRPSAPPASTTYRPINNIDRGTSLRSSIFGLPTPKEILEEMALLEEEEIVDLSHISNLFTIDYAAFRSDYEPHESDTDEEFEEPPRFVLRNRQDLKKFLYYLLEMHKLTERDVIFNVEASALMIHTILASHSHKSYILKMLHALLKNNVHRVFKLVDFQDGFQAHLGGYNYMSMDDSSSSDDDDSSSDDDDDDEGEEEEVKSNNEEESNDNSSSTEESEFEHSFCSDGDDDVD